MHARSLAVQVSRQFNELVNPIDCNGAGTCVVVPVHRDAAATAARCIESVLCSRPMNRAFDLLVIDDASLEPEVVRYLDAQTLRRS